MKSRSRGAAVAALQKFEQFEAAAEANAVAEVVDARAAAIGGGGYTVPLTSEEHERQRRAAAEAKAEATAKRLQAEFGPSLPSSSAGPVSGGPSGAESQIRPSPSEPAAEGAKKAATTAAAAPAASGEKRFIGRIKAFNTMQGWGFIQCAEIMTMYGCDAFLNQAVEGGIAIGGIVSFEVEVSKAGKPQARRVVLEVAPATTYHVAGGEENDGAAAAAASLAASAVTPAGGPLYRGRVKSFNAARGFGFLACPELQRTFGGRDIYVSRAQAPDGRLVVGQEVDFRLIVDRQGQPQGRDISEVTPAPAFIGGADTLEGSASRVANAAIVLGVAGDSGPKWPGAGPGVAPVIPAGGEAHPASWRLFG